LPAELVFESVPAAEKLVYLEEPTDNKGPSLSSEKTPEELQKLKKLQQDNKNKLIEVGKQQEQFEK